MALSHLDPNPGPNDWLVEELRQQYQANPRSVSDAWREVFETEDSNGHSTGSGPANGQAASSLATLAPEPTVPLPAAAVPAALPPAPVPAS